MKRIAKTDHMPDYRLVYDSPADQIVFYARTPQGAIQEAKAVLEHPQGRLF